MTDINSPTVSNAVISLVPNHSGFNIEDGKIIAWNTADKKTEAIQPTQAEIDTELVRLQAAYDSLKYARDRVSAYASVGDQMDMIYKDTKNSTTTHANAVEAVKTKWPKDNSGPIE